MTPAPANSKAAIRAAIRARLQTVSPEQRSLTAAAACARLAETTLWRQARRVLLYAPLPDELDVWPVFALAQAAGKTVALPRFDAATQIYTAAIITNDARDLVLGPFGVREPAPTCPGLPLNQLDLVLVPGVAFALDGSRLGRGKGFYDRLLASVRGTTCGVAHDEQIVAAVPVEPHDVRLNHILTPTRWHLASPARF